MSFGFSIGDFIALAKLVEGTRKRFKGAPAEYAALADECGALLPTSMGLLLTQEEHALSRL